MTTFAPAVKGLHLTDPNDNTYAFAIRHEENGGQAVRVATVPWEAGASARPWVRDLFPFDAGAARTKDRNPRGLSLQPQIPADTFYPDSIQPGPAVTEITLTSGTIQATKMIQARDNAGTAIFAICGRFLVRVSSAYVIAATDLGSSRVATDIVQVNSDLIICFGATDFIKRRNPAGTISSSVSAYAHSIVIVNDRVWKVRNSNATVENTLSYLVGLNATDATALLTLSNWTTPNPAYLVGDNTYQCTMLYDNGGTIAGGRADGIYMPNPEYKFLNVTPQIKRAPDFSGDTGKGCWSAFGYFFVPYHRGLLRLSPGFAEDVGVGTLYLPGVGLRVRDGLEWDRMMYVLCSEERTGDLYLFKMRPDKEDISDGEYIWQPIFWRSASTTHFGRSMAMLTASTQPTLVFGGGDSATDAQYIKLGRGSGRDLDDSGYVFSSAANYVTTGLFSPAEDSSMVATLVGSQVYVGRSSGPTTPVTIQYSALTSQMPGDNPTTEMTTSDGAMVPIETTGHSIRYAAPNSQGSFFNLRLKLDGTGTIAPTVLRWRAFGLLNPRTTDEITTVLDLRDISYSGSTAASLNSASKAMDLLRGWKDRGTILTGRVEAYEENLVGSGHPLHFTIKDISAGHEKVAAAGGGEVSVDYLCTVSLLRVDYAELYAGGAR